MSKYDHSKEREGNFPVFPNMTLKVQLHSVKRTQAKNKGTPGIQWIATIVEPEEHQGRFISTVTYLSENSLWKVAQVIEAFGITGAPIVDTDSEAFFQLCSACIGHTCYWRNEQRDYEGRKQNNIVDMAADPQQTVAEFTVDAEVPDWAKS